MSFDGRNSTPIVVEQPAFAVLVVVSGAGGQIKLIPQYERRLPIEQERSSH